MFQSISQQRFLLYELVARDVRGRYLGSVLGLFWSVVNPLLQLVLYTVVFSVVLKIRIGTDDSTGRFAIFLFCALLPFIAVQESTTRAARAFLDHANLIKRMRFPLSAIPLSLVVSALVHQIIGTAVFGLILAAIGELHWAGLIWLVPLLLVQGTGMYGVALVFACANVFLKDIAQILGVLFMVLFWLTPIVYPLERAPETFQRLLALNPLTPMVEAYRWALLGERGVVSPLGIGYWVAFSLLLLALGCWAIKRTREDLVDLI